MILLPRHHCLGTWFVIYKLCHRSIDESSVLHCINIMRWIFTQTAPWALQCEGAACLIQGSSSWIINLILCLQGKREGESERNISTKGLHTREMMSCLQSGLDDITEGDDIIFFFFYLCVHQLSCDPPALCADWIPVITEGCSVTWFYIISCETHISVTAMLFFETEEMSWRKCR